MAGDYSLWTYVGDCGWRFIKSQPSRVANELQTQRDTWFGRADQLAQFLAQHPLYSGYTGEDGSLGYITKVTPDDAQGPFSTVDFEISLQPDFQRYLVNPSWSIKSVSATATVTGDNLIPPTMLPDGVDVPDSLVCTRTITAYCPQSEYTYFTSAMPQANRFSSYSGSLQPKILTSRISCNIGGNNIVFAGATASAPIVSALTLPLVSVVTSFGGDQIPGTPWYKCKDVVTYQYQGDST